MEFSEKFSQASGYKSRGSYLRRREINHANWLKVRNELHPTAATEDMKTIGADPSVHRKPATTHVVIVTSGELEELHTFLSVRFK